jgi:predicted dienelactone hydrolase
MKGRRFSRGGALPLFAAAMAFGCATAAPPTPPPATSSTYSSAPVRGASQAVPDTTGAPGAGAGRAAGAGNVTGARFAAPGALVTRVLDTSFDDPSRDRRLPVRLRVPQPCTSGERRPVVLFSHGLGGSRAGGAHWGEHWSAHGFAVLHLQHPGSDEALWRGRAGGFANLAGLRAGATPEQFVLRAQDVRAAIDALARRVAADPTLACLDVARLGMSGHSFGALTTQAIAGQSLPVPEQGAARPWLVEPRIRAAIAFSPSMRDGGPAARAAFGTVRIPFLAITGGLDGDVLGTGATAALRRAVFDALPPGDRFLLWFGGGDHMVFNGGPPRPPAADGRDDDVRVQRVTAAVTLAFWKAMLTGDAAARAWLDAGGPRSLLGDADVWSSR